MARQKQDFCETANESRITRVQIHADESE